MRLLHAASHRPAVIFLTAMLFTHTRYTAAARWIGGLAILWRLYRAVVGSRVRSTRRATTGARADP